MRSLCWAVSWTVLGLTFAIEASLHGSLADDMAPLTDEPARGELFQMYADEVAAQSGVASYAFPYTFRFSRDALYDVDGSQRTDTIFGIDISHYQGNKFPLADLKSQQVSFVYVKATQGTTGYDDVFEHNWKTLGDLPPDKKVPRGAYHFLSSATLSGSDQADAFVNYVKAHGDFAATDLPPAVDLEWDKTCAKDTCPDRWTVNHRSADDIIKTVVDYVSRVKERTGRTCLIYTNRSFLNDHGITSEEQIVRLTKGAKIWIFDISGPDLKDESPNPKKNLAHDLWQFSWGAKVTGYGSTIDADVFQGSAADFAAKFLAGD